MYKLQIDDYIDRHFEEMLDELKKLIRIDSKRGESTNEYPFGKKVYKVLNHTQSLLESYGFKVKNHENYVITADIDDKKNYLDILAHLDVVPEGDGWSITKPFEPLVDSGKIYGRGTADDKGPAIAAIFALRAVKDLGIPITKGVRLILGSDEECGSSDLRYYYSKNEEAACSFTPDADFPLINAEKGRLETSVVFKSKDNKLKKYIASINVGTKANVIPGASSMLVAGYSMEELNNLLKDVKDVSLETEGELIKILVSGEFGHAAFPENSDNALVKMLKMIPLLNLDNSDIHEKLIKLGELFSSYYGEKLGIAMEDEITGKLTIVLTMLSLKNNELELTFDCRAPLVANDDNLTSVLKKQFINLGFDFPDIKMVLPHLVPEDSDFVQNLLQSYSLYFDEEAKCSYTGGGTYVHHLKNGVAFGCAINGVDNRMHGPDEFMDLDVLRKSAKIFANAIVKVCL